LKFLQAAICGLLAASCLTWLGCGSETKSKDREESTLKPLMVVLGQYVGQHRGQLPANEAELKDYLSKLKKEQLAAFGIQDYNSLLVSSRDHKPYVILYGSESKGNPPGPGGQPVIAYEQEGAGGKRFVASSLGAVQEVDEAEFKRLVPGAKTP
jgi:hypothetical protein